MQDVTLDLLESLNCPHCGAAFPNPLPEAFLRIQCETCGEKSTVPGKFGKFLLYQTQGESITSTVFDAFDPKLGRNVTLKILNYVLSKNPELVEAFKHEALAAAALNSTYVLKVYEFGIHNRQPFMVMEHIEGKFLNQVLQEEQLSEYRILEIISGIVQGLQDMHQVGIMHGDVMPRNILIHTDGTPRISDFGLARFNSESGSDGPGNPWESWSSPYYMPPERIEGKEEDFRGDFYSLGTCLFSMLTGELPFFDLDESKVLEMKLTAEPPDPREIHPEISEGMADLTLALMQRRPEERPADYQELRARIAEIKHQIPRPEKLIPRAERPPDFHQNASPGRKKEPVAWFVFLVLLAILIAMVISIPLRKSKDPLPPPGPTALPAEPSPTPLPPATPTPSASLTVPLVFPTPIPPPPTPTPFPDTPLSFAGIEVYLIPPPLLPGQPSGLSSWENELDRQPVFSQPDETKQPAKVSSPGQPSRLYFSHSHLVSALLPQRMDRFTLLTYVQIDPTALSTQPMFLMGIDPKSKNERFIQIVTDPTLPYSFRFQTERGSALLTLPLAERSEAFLIGFRRGEEVDDAFLGSRRAVLATSPSGRDVAEPGRFPGFQLGDLEGDNLPFKGWLGEFVFFSRTLGDAEIAHLADLLHKSFGEGP